jgi:hypothetical protein
MGAPGIAVITGSPSSMLKFVAGLTTEVKEHGSPRLSSKIFAEAPSGTRHAVIVPEILVHVQQRIGHFIGEFFLNLSPAVS